MPDTLTTRLNALLASRREIAVWNAAYEQILERLSHDGFLQNVLPEGAAFPDFMLPSAEGKLVSLDSRLAQGPVVVSFFRGEWCPFCRLMLAALTEALPEIEAAGGTLLGDVDFGVGLAAGVVFRIPKLYRARCESSGLNFPQRHGNAAWCLPVPATFILTPDGKVAWRFVDVDFSHRAEPADIIAALRQLGPQ